MPRFEWRHLDRFGWGWPGHIGIGAPRELWVGLPWPCWHQGSEVGLGRCAGISKQHLRISPKKLEGAARRENMAQGGD